MRFAHLIKRRITAITYKLGEQWGLEGAAFTLNNVFFWGTSEEMAIFVMEAGISRNSAPLGQGNPNTQGKPIPARKYELFFVKHDDILTMQIDAGFILDNTTENVTPVTDSGMSKVLQTLIHQQLELMGIK